MPVPVLLSFTAKTNGTVQFGSQVSAGSQEWSRVIYRDLDCNSKIDATDTILEQADLTNDQKLCLVTKVNVPLQASTGSSHNLAVTATFSLQGTTVQQQMSITDVTIVGGNDSMRLTKTVDKTSASPGETVTYALTFENMGIETISDMKINDTTPAYTVFTNGDCGNTDQAQLYIRCARVYATETLNVAS